MSNPLIHEVDYFVILEPGKDEMILSAVETQEWLVKWLKKIDELPKDLMTIGSVHKMAERLIETSCRLEVEPGYNIQWFAIRIDPPVKLES